nr:uncharacterized protein LOC105336665 [Crassostrea gigas]
MKWVLNEIEDKTLALTLSANLTIPQPVLPTLRLPNMRFTNTGGCLEMEYRATGDDIRLDLSTAKQNLTSLQNSTKWMPIKVNLDYSSDDYQIIMTPVSNQASSVNFEIKYIHIQYTPCKDCFACLEDHLCIQNEKFCDMNVDCPDESDERNCALECYYENVYKGVRKETKSLHHCRSGTTCNFDDFHQKRLGCYYDKESRFAWVQEWDECSVSKCNVTSLNCDFERDMCNWKFLQKGIQYNRQKADYTDKIVISAKLNILQEGSNEEKAVLFSAPQPPTSDFGCITISYAGKGVRLQLLFTKGTFYTNNERVYEGSEFDYTVFKTTSVAITPKDIPYMVQFVIVYIFDVVEQKCFVYNK